MVSDPLLWMEKINDFAKGEIAAYVADIDEYLLKLTQFQGEDLSELLWDVVGGYGHDQPGSRLIQCGMGTLPDKSMNPSIIYASYLENGRPVTVSPRTYTWLATAHLHKVVVGHQPNADVPLVVNNYHHQNYISVSLFSSPLLCSPSLF